MYRYFLAIRYLLSRPINLLGMFAFLISVWALIVVVSIFSGFIREVRLHLQSASSDVVAFYLGDNADFDQLQKEILRDPNVEACAPRLVYAGLLHPRPRKPGEALPFPKTRSKQKDILDRDHRLLTLIGIDPGLERRVTGLDTWLADVKDPRLRVVEGAQDPSWLWLSEVRARKEQVIRDNQLTVTSADLRVTSGQNANALDLIEHRFRLGGAYSTQHSSHDEFNAFLHIDVLRKMLDQRPNFVTEIVIRVKDKSQSLATAARLKNHLAGLPEFRRLAPEVETWEQRFKNQLLNFEHQRSLLRLVLFVIMVVSGFLVYATLSMMVTEKTRDIGILSAMGATRGGVMQVFLSCGFAIGLVGTVLGVIFGCITAINLDSIRDVVRSTTGIDLFPVETYNLPHVPYELDPVWIILVSVIAMGLGLLVSGIPALMAACHDPLRSLRNE